MFNLKDKYNFTCKNGSSCRDRIKASMSLVTWSRVNLRQGSGTISLSITFFNSFKLLGGCEFLLETLGLQCGSRRFLLSSPVLKTRLIDFNFSAIGFQEDATTTSFLTTPLIASGQEICEKNPPDPVVFYRSLGSGSNQTLVHRFVCWEPVVQKSAHIDLWLCVKS